MRVRMWAIGKAFDQADSFFDRRFVSRPSWVVLAELFLGIGWLRSAVAKAIKPKWWSGDELADFVASHHDHTIGWYQPILDVFVTDYGVVWAAIVLVAEILVGLALLTSNRLGAGLAAGIFLNINFLLVGAPNPSMFYLVLQFGLVLWLLEGWTNTASSRRILRVISLSGVVLTMALLPYVRTIDPALIIDDPAATLAAWALFGAITAVVARRRVKRQRLRAPLIDVRTEAEIASLRG